MIGRRIAVYGPSGSGKSTFGRRIAASLGLPVIEIDAIFWRQNWTMTPDDEFRAKVSARLAECESGWVAEGNYHQVRDIVMPQAETIIWLRLPFLTVYPRLVYRTVARAWSRQPLWGTNFESWRQSFLSRDSILLWGISHWRAHHRGVESDIRGLRPAANVHVLRSTDAVARFLAKVEATVDLQSSGGLLWQTR